MYLLEKKSLPRNALNLDGRDLEVRWLRLCASNAGGARWLPGQGTEIPHVLKHRQTKQTRTTWGREGRAAFWTKRSDTVLNPRAATSLYFFNFKKVFKIFWLHHMAYRILVPWPKIKPLPPAVGAQIPNHWTAREFPVFFKIKFSDH